MKRATFILIALLVLAAMVITGCSKAAPDSNSADCGRDFK